MPRNIWQELAILGHDRDVSVQCEVNWNGAAIARGRGSGAEVIL